jgi:hypothetical protein
LSTNFIFNQTVRGNGIHYFKVLKRCHITIRLHHSLVVFRLKFQCEALTCFLLTLLRLRSLNHLKLRLLKVWLLHYRCFVQRLWTELFLRLIIIFSCKCYAFLLLIRKFSLDWLSYFFLMLLHYWSITLMLIYIFYWNRNLLFFQWWLLSPHYQILLRFYFYNFFC